MEAHPLAQGDASAQAVGAELRQCRRQPWFELPLPIGGVQGIANGAQELGSGQKIDIDRIDGIEAASC